MVWKDYIQLLQWILYKIIELQVGKGISLIFEMCAVIAFHVIVIYNLTYDLILEITDVQ